MGPDNQKKLRVLLFTTLFPHAGEPTLGVFVRNRLEHLIEDENIEATVIAPVPYFPFTHAVFGSYGRSAKAHPVERQKGLTVYHPRFVVIPKIGARLNARFLAKAGLAAAKKLIAAGQRFDVVDAHYLYPDGVAAVEIAQSLNLPVVMTARGSDVTQIALMEPYQRMIMMAIDKASHVITVSQSLKDKLSSLGADPQKITPLRNGVDTNKFVIKESAKLSLAREFGFDPTKPLILYAGWLIPRKRVDIAIDALTKLNPNVQLLVVGDGPLMNNLRNQASQSGCAERIIFAGQQKPARMVDFFSASDVLILPSEREGWANVLLEAMACGTPVVSRAVDGALELVVKPEAGRLVEGNNPDHYAAALAELLAKNYSPILVRSYAEKFNWRATSRGQFEIFETAINLHKHINTGSKYAE